jgi:carboxyl-terminal processing protease
LPVDGGREHRVPPGFLAVVFCFWGLVIGCGARPILAAQGGMPEEVSVLASAMEAIRTHGLNAPQSTRKMVDDILRAYAHSVDDYSDYLTATEYAAYLQSTSSDYFGVQMDLQKRRDTLLLFPFRGGLAEKSGIAAGDELIAVDGVPVYGKSVYVVGALIRGTEGETVQLTLRTGRALARTVTLRRQRTRYQSVSWTALNQANSIQITRFTKDTETQLRTLLAQMPDDGTPLLIDVRGNQGGSLISARQCADLFVEPGTVLFRLRDREGTRAILAEQPKQTAARLILIQDGGTASAAEAFMAALRSGAGALTVGSTSYGKGLAQRFLPLSDGSALLLTYAEMLTADNRAFHERGLVPDIDLPRELAVRDFTQERAVSALLDFITTNQD